MAQWPYFTCFLFCACSAAMALQRPAEAERARYKADGTFAQRLRKARTIGNHRVRPALAARLLQRTDNETGNQPIVNAPLPNWQGMPTTGTNEMLVFLIEFPDYPHNEPAASIENKLFGAGSPADYPFESLSAFYTRSSYGQLTLQGNVLGWYEMAHNRNWYTDQYGTGNQALLKMIEEVVDHYDAAHDYAQYDNNGDGRIDYFAVVWTGPDTGWGDFWWGYQWNLYSGDLRRDGVRFYDFSWQWESRPVGGAFDPKVIIHETGHVLGLPDYYDYDPSAGPPGGVGGLDMMDSGWGDHTAFSKYMLEWLTPTFITSGSQSLSLRASAQFPDAVAIMKDYGGASPYGEYFIVENRHRVRNDSDHPADGLLIWHVDATPDANGNDFLYDNSYTTHKLLRLMEADGLEEIETGDGNADAGDFYETGNAFTADSTPNSSRYNGVSSGVKVFNISAAASTMSAAFAVDSTPPPSLSHSPEALVQSVVQGSNADSQTVEVWANGGALSYTVGEASPYFSVYPLTGSSAGGGLVVHTVYYSTTGLGIGTYQGAITLASPTAANAPVTIPVTINVFGTNLPVAVDAPSLKWATGGDTAWRELSGLSSHDGIDCASAGDVYDNQLSWVSAEAVGPAFVTFWWKVSSEENYDYFHFYVDDVLQPGSLSGAEAWRMGNAHIGPGAHVLRWAYVKDYSVSAGDDTGWLDQVTVTPDTRDSDADGFLDWEEEVAGTAPTIATSRLELTARNLSPATRAVELSWPSAPKRIYSVEQTASLNNPFTPIATNLPATPTVNTFTVDAGTTPTSFYRVGVSVEDDSVMLIDESFSGGGTPAGWTVVDYAGGAVWTFNDPGQRGNLTGGDGGFAIADSDAAGMVSMLTDLQLPVLDFSSYSNVTLQFRTDFMVYTVDSTYAPLASVDAQVNGGDWLNLWQRYGEHDRGPVVETVDISPTVAGHAQVLIAFYYEGDFDWWWQIDDVKVWATPAP